MLRKVLWDTIQNVSVSGEVGGVCVCVLCNNVTFDVTTQLSGKIRRVNNYRKNYIVNCTSPALM